MSTKFTPTPSELVLVSQIFTQADTQKLGILTGDVAVKVFGGAKLPPAVLGEIWSIADEDNNGWLPRKGVAIAIRLMGWAQRGEKVSQELIYKPGPMPTIDGVSPLVQQSTGLSLPKSPPPSLPQLTAQERAKFLSLFNKAGPGSDGLLSGAKARDIFLKSKLNNDTLLKIWNLADTRDRGALDSTDFVIGMYFIQGMMSGQLSFVPTTLPPGLFEQAAGLPAGSSSTAKSHVMGGGPVNGSFSPSSSSFPSLPSSLQHQHTGQSQSQGPLLQPNYTGISAARPPPAIPPRAASKGLPSAPFIPPRNGHLPAWDVMPAERANSDQFFDELDTQKRGFIEGDTAVPFMLKSQLPEEDLARIWDLSDLNHNGKLTRDGLAVAMHLIQKRLGGGDIPDTLPSSLVPPSMRPNMTSPFSPAPSNPQVPEPVKDLLWDDSPPNSAVAQQPTGPAFSSSITGNTSQTFPFSAPKSLFQSDPFLPSASRPAPSNRNFLDDDDETHSSDLHDQSAEIGNLQNQLSSTIRSTESMKAERVSLEQTLANQASQLSALQTQLSSAKAACETESKLLSALNDRHATQAADIQKAREELIRAESDLSAVRVEKAEVEGSFLRDKEDARELHRRMVEVSQQVEVLKAEVERLKKDAKQQKGLLAIAKKQLSSKEVDKSKVDKELEQAAAEAASTRKELEEAEAELAGIFHQSPSYTPPTAAAYPLPVSHPASPDPSSPNGLAQATKSNNPFDRLSRAPSPSESHSPPTFLPFASPPTGTNDVSTLDKSTELFGIGDTVKDEPQTFDDIFNESASGVAKEKSDVDMLGPEPTDLTDLRESTFSATTVDGENDRFVTPPMSASGHEDIPSSLPLASVATLETKFPALEDLATKFPSIQTNDDKLAPPLQPSEQSNRQETETDLNARLQDLEVEDSDSDSDSEDEVPLAHLAKPKANDNSVSKPPQPESQTRGMSFDDIFGVPSSVQAVSVTPVVNGSLSDATLLPVSNGSLMDQAFTPFDPPAAHPEPIVAGVSAFDEAMGAIPVTSVAPRTFSFDTAFDDDFDFASAKKEEVAPTSSNGQQKNDDLNAIFSEPEASKTKTLSFIRPYDPAPAEGASTSKPTFDEVFSNLDRGPSEDSNNSFMSTNTRASTSTDRTIPNQTAFPTSPTSQTPTTSPRSVSSPPLPARPKSPPARTSSPKGRPSTSSGKDVQEKPKEKEIPTRHSKLSIRLPFGRKKKQQQQQQELTPSLAPPQEDTRIPSLSGEDDIESVKQITAMGFTRSQAVNALEQNAFDMNRALNSLLGA